MIPALGNFSLGGVPLLPIQDLILMVDDVDRLGYVQVRSIQKGIALGQRTSLRFRTVTKDSDFNPIAGHSIRFYVGGTLSFNGSIERTSSAVLGFDPNNKAETIDIECVDKTQTLDRRLLFQNYETPEQTAGDIALDIITRLANEGLLPGTIEPGVKVEKAIFPYVTYTQALRELADLSGVNWWIDSYDNVNFVEQSSYIAPFQLTEQSRPYKNFQNNSTREQLKNRYYLRAGKALTDLQTENFAGDGQRRTFTIAFPFGRLPTVLVNRGFGFIEESVGIRRDGSNSKWFMDFGSNEINQNESESVLGLLHVLRINYQGLFPLIMQGDSLTSVTERKEVEDGTTGLYESLEDDQDVDTLALAVLKIQTLLRRFAKLLDTASFDTFRSGLRPGQIITINLPDSENIEGEFLITEVNESVILEKDFAWASYNVKVTSGEFVGGWLDWFRRLEERGKRFVIRENEILSLGPVTFDVVGVSDEIETDEPLDNGENDPYSGLIVAGDNDPVEMKRFFDFAGAGGANVQNIEE